MAVAANLNCLASFQPSQQWAIIGRAGRARAPTINQSRAETGWQWQMGHRQLVRRSLYNSLSSLQWLRRQRGGRWDLILVVLLHLPLFILLPLSVFATHTRNLPF